MKYCVYSKSTGEIRAVFDTCPSEAQRQLQSEDEALYPVSADPRRYRIIDGALIDLKERDPADGSTWRDEENCWISPADMRSRQASIARLKMVELETKRQPRIEREIRLRPNEIGVDGKTPRQRLEELDSEMDKLRAVINAGMDTTAREG